MTEQIKVNPFVWRMTDAIKHIDPDEKWHKAGKCDRKNGPAVENVK